MVKYKRSCSKAQLAALARGRAIRARNIQLGGASRSPTSRWRRHSSGSSSGSPSRSPSPPHRSRSPRRPLPNFELGSPILERGFEMRDIEHALPPVSPCAARRPRKPENKCSKCTALLAILTAAGIGAAGKFGTVGTVSKVRKLITGKRAGDMCVDGAPPHNLLHKDYDLAQELCGEYASPVQSCPSKTRAGDVVWYPISGEECARLSHGEKKVKAIGSRKNKTTSKRSMNRQNKSVKNKRKTGRKR